MIRCIARRQASFCRAATLTSNWHCRPRVFGDRDGANWRAVSRGQPPACRRLPSAVPHFIRLNDCSSNNFRAVPSIASIGTALENSYRLRGNSRVQYRNITTTRYRG